MDAGGGCLGRFLLRLHFGSGFLAASVLGGAGGARCLRSGQYLGILCSELYFNRLFDPSPAITDMSAGDPKLKLDV